MSQLQVATLLAALLIAAVHSCDPSCTLSFCDGGSAFALGHEPDVPFSSAVCIGKRRLTVAETGEAVVNGAPISTLLATNAGHFARTFFKMYSTPHGAAVGRQTATAAQIATLKNACVSVPVRRVQIDSQNIDSAECVSFIVKPTAPSRMLRPAHELPLGGGRLRLPPASKTARLGAVFRARRYYARASLGTTHLRRELYVLADATGSMGKLLAPLHGKMQAILGKSAFDRFAIGSYRDELDGYAAGFSPGLPLRVHTAAPVARILKNLDFERGGDHDEAALHALEAVASDTTGEAAWSAGSLRALLWLGDSPSHEPSCANGRKATRQTATRALKKANIHVLAVDLARGARGLNAAPAAYGCKKTARRFASAGQATFIARGTHGRILAASRGSVVKTVRQALHKVPLVVKADAAHCQRMLRVERVQVDGKLAIGDDGRSARATIFVTARACARKQGFSCVVRFLAGGAVVGELPIDVSRVRGCWGWK